MKPTINLFFDFEFTSLSPDAQPISLGIVSEGCIDKTEAELISSFVFSGSSKYHVGSRSFYAEFTDFDINRCDEWVKENVVGKLKFKNALKSNGGSLDDENNPTILGKIEWVKSHLRNWLSQFSDYEIQFVCDNGTFDWYWMLQLIGEWEQYPCKWKYPDDSSMSGCYINLAKAETLDHFKSRYNRQRSFWMKNKGIDTENKTEYDHLIPIEFIKIGLPKLPENISPVPQDLNDLIALKKRISVREVFDLNRENLASGPIDVSDQVEFWGKSGKHNSLWDAKVIKKIYNNLQ
jgi:hypothetical protein